MLYNILGLP